ncbi:GNAT family N-acetyltransferase [Micromonospora sp. DT47]|uniref:GNAT family N-acetyltransferase n=1 Tax=Micromonospora sp. DT47 TaxID=3393431 RepID=UPI003CF52EA5
MRLRHLDPRDFDAVSVMLRQVYIGEGYTAAQYADVLTDVAARHAAPGTTILVAAGDDGLIAGHVVVCTSASPLAQLAAADEAEIRLLATAANMRGQGVGRALIQAAIEKARSGGSRRIVLATQTTMTAAQRLYASEGFHRIPAADWSWDGRRFLAYALPL